MTKLQKIWDFCEQKKNACDKNVEVIGMDNMITLKEFAKDFVKVYSVVATISMVLFYGLDWLVYLLA